MGACCNTADKDTTTECQVPGGQLQNQRNQQFKTNGKSNLELFQYQQLEIFQPQNNNQVVMVSVTSQFEK